MTVLTASAPTTSVADRLRGVLRLDAAACAGLGLVALAGPLTLYGSAPGWLPRAAGAALLVCAADLMLAARWSGRALRLAAVVAGELALLLAVALVAVVSLRDLPSSGVLLLLSTAAVSAALGLVELRLARALR